MNHQLTTLLVIFATLLHVTKAEAACHLFNLDRYKKNHLKVIPLDASNEGTVLRYLNATQGTPPDFSKLPNHKSYYVAQTGSQFCDGNSCSPAPQGAIMFVDATCVIYQINGTVPQLNKIVAGQWSLSTH